MILTEEQTMIQDMARGYVQERIAPFSEEWDKNKTFPAEALQGLGELGFYGMLVPEQWGGSGVVLTGEGIRVLQALNAVILCACQAVGMDQVEYGGG